MLNCFKLALANIDVQSSSTALMSNPPTSVLKNKMFAPFQMVYYHYGSFVSAIGDVNPWLVVDLGTVRIISAVQIAKVGYNF